MNVMIGVALEHVDEIRILNTVLVEIGVEGRGEVGTNAELRGNDDGSENSVDVRVVEEEMLKMTGCPVMERIVEEGEGRA